MRSHSSDVPLVAVLVTALSLFLATPRVVTATATPVGTEFLVNVSTLFHQERPRVVYAGAGSFLVAWQDQQVHALSVNVRRIDGTGTPLGPEIVAWSGGLTADAPQVAAAAAGHFIVVDTANDFDGDGLGIRGRLFSGGGTPMGPEFQVNTYTTGHQDRPAVAADGSGGFLVVWSSDGQDGSEGTIIGQRYDATGAAIGGEFQINTDTFENQTSPAVTLDAAGNFVVVWNTHPGIGVRGQRLDATGAFIGTELGIAPGGGEPEVATDAGGFLVIWNASDGSDDGVFARRYDATGTPQTGAFQVNAYTPREQHIQSVAADGTGSFLVVWGDPHVLLGSDSRDGSLAGVFGRRIDSAGVPTGEDFQVNTYTPSRQHEPSIAGDGAGSFVVVWKSRGSQDGSGYGIFGQGMFVCDPPCVACEKCEPGVGCVVAPRDDCRVPAVPLKAQLRLSDSDDDGADRLKWRWVKGEETPEWLLGDPVDHTDYTLCLYETVGGVSNLLLDATAPAGGTCGPASLDCWETAGGGFKYRDKDRAADGLELIRVKSGAERRSSIKVKARGSNLGMPSPLGLGLPVTVQLENSDGSCWNATYHDVGVSKNDPTQFKARAGSPGGAFLDLTPDVLD